MMKSLGINNCLNNLAATILHLSIGLPNPSEMVKNVSYHLPPGNHGEGKAKT